MAATIPTLKELYDSIIAQLETDLNVDIPEFGKVFLRAFAAVQAAKLKIYYLAIGNVQKNVFVDTAETEAIGGTLERFGRVKLGRNPFPARVGEYLVTVTGSIGATIPAGTTWKSDDANSNPGKLFILNVAHVMITAADNITIEALEGGLGSQQFATETLTATAPIVNVDSLVSVQSEEVAPLEAEDLEDYRRKAVEAYQLEAQGGAAADYRIWSSDAQGVERVYPYLKSGQENQIDLFVEATVADSIDGKGTPSAALLLEVEEVIEFDPDTTKALEDRGRRPLTVNQIFYTAITPLDVNVTINNFVGLTAEITTEINATLDAVISEIRPFVAAADVEANRNDEISVNKLVAAVQDVIPAGTKFDTLTFTVNAVPVPISLQFLNGDIPNFNTLVIT